MNTSEPKTFTPLQEEDIYYVVVRNQKKGKDDYTTIVGVWTSQQAATQFTATKMANPLRARNDVYQCIPTPNGRLVR